MYRFLAILLLSFGLFSSFSSAQFNPQNYWSDINESQIELLRERDIIPKAYRTVSLNVEQMKNLLQTAPLEFTINPGGKDVVMELPYPDGTMQRFIIFDSPIMEPELAAKYPDIKTYSGFGVDDKYATIRFDLTPLGFHAMVLSPNGAVFIDPYTIGDLHNYISYYKRDYVKFNSDFECELLYEENKLNELEYLKGNNILTPTGPQLRTYRLANAATGEYTTYHGGTVALGLAAVVTTINRVDGIYEREVAVRMVLIANNDLIIYTNGSTDPYTNTNGSAMLGQNISNLSSVIGNANFDIGHVFSTGGGGVAYLGCVCTSSKAGGVTGSSAPVGDPFDVDYVAHEMGHQFGANHTFNGTAGSCSGGNRNASTAYEPGSASTIMGYAGICYPQDLQPNSDPYFHTISFDEIVSYTNFGNGNGCAVVTSTGNLAPVINMPVGGFYIPKSTPFAITGSATDPNGDALTYCWEEFDLGPAGAPNSPSGNAPIFRSWNPTNSPTRIFPRLQNLSNNNTVIGELLPTYARTLTFRLTVRDSKMGGGGVDRAQFQFSVDGNSGPFLVTSPNTNVSWSALSTQTVTWDVANTNVSPVNCANVNILLSTDGGNTWPVVLAANTPNDGSEDVVIPDNQVTTARIKVEAAGNIFFDISNVNFTISQPVPVELTMFTAERLEAGVLLSWETATETNNSGFEVERSRDSENFASIGFVPGKGTTTQKSNYSFIDTDIEIGSYYYRLKQVDFDGTYKYYNVVTVDAGLPKDFLVMQNYPNPFNPVTSIKFQLPVDSKVKVEIFNTLGEKIAELLNNQLSAGFQEVSFDGANQASGIFYYVVTASGIDGSNFRSVKKMILMK
ncbi:MAG: zinc-dependent metalloprotease family protein [Ignavibacteriaceae bacterium]|jgi:hypothetical protein|nr:zinc-dependent metalloprotease family protein [Ignavibacteriaceae bacterium]